MTVYFGNTVNDKAYLIVNDGFQSFELDERGTTESSGVVTAINLTAKEIPSAANKDRDKWGTGGGTQNTNKLRVQFASLADPQAYEVVTDVSLARDDLYFYVFDTDLVGQNRDGQSAGITVTKVAAP